MNKSSEVLEVLGPLPVTTIAAYKKHTNLVPELSAKYGHIPDVSTKDGYDNAVAGIREVKKVRVDLEKARKSEKADVLARSKAIDGEARLIREALESIENPMKEAKQLFDTRKEREQKEALASALNVSHDGTVDSLQSALSAIELIAIDDFPDIAGEAISAKVQKASELKEALSAALRAQELARVERERQAKFKEEQRALAERQEEQRKRELEHAVKQAEEREKLDRQRAEIEAAQIKEQARINAEREAVEKQRLKQQAEERERQVAIDKETAARVESERKVKAELDAKTNKQAIIKMRERLATVDWNKPSDEQIKMVWFALKSN